MITEDYCSYEVSKLLKEKRFDRACPYWYDKEKNMKIFPGLVSTNTSNRGISCPTHQMAMKWLREEHDIIIVIEPHSYNHIEEKTSSYDFSIWYGDNYEHPLTTNYPTYEETVEAALKYSLENLIF